MSSAKTPRKAPNSFLTDPDVHHDTSSKLRTPKVNASRIQSADDDALPFLPSQSALVANYEEEVSPRKHVNQRALQYDEITRVLHDRSPRKDAVTSPYRKANSTSLKAAENAEGFDDEEIIKAQEHLNHMRQLRLDTEERLRRQKGSEKQRMQELHDFLTRMNADEEQLMQRITRLQDEQQRRKQEKHRAMVEARERERQKYAMAGKAGNPHLQELPMFKKKEEERKELEMQQEQQRLEFLARKRQEQLENKFKKEEIVHHQQKHDEILREKLTSLEGQRLQNIQKLKSPRSEPRIAVSKTLQQTREQFGKKTGYAYEMEQNREKMLRGREYAAHVKSPAIDRAKMEEMEQRRKKEAAKEAERLRRKQEGEEKMKKLMKDKQLASRLVKQGNTEVRKMSPEKFRNASKEAEEEEKKDKKASPKYTNYLVQMRLERERREEEEGEGGASDRNNGKGTASVSKDALLRNFYLRVERQEQRVEKAEIAYKNSVAKCGMAHEDTIQAATTVDELRCELIDLKFRVLAVKEGGDSKESVRERGRGRGYQNRRRSTGADNMDKLAAEGNTDVRPDGDADDVGGRKASIYENIDSYVDQRHVEGEKEVEEVGEEVEEGIDELMEIDDNADENDSNPEDDTVAINDNKNDDNVDDVDKNPSLNGDKATSKAENDKQPSSHSTENAKTPKSPVSPKNSEKSGPETQNYDEKAPKRFGLGDLLHIMADVVEDVLTGRDEEEEKERNAGRGADGGPGKHSSQRARADNAVENDTLLGVDDDAEVGEEIEEDISSV